MDRKLELIQKYIANELSDEGLRKFNSLLKEDEDFQQQFKKYVHDNYLTDVLRLEESAQFKLNRVEKNNLFKEQKERNLFVAWQKYAAILVLVFAVSWGIWKVSNRAPEANSQRIVLKMDDGSTRLLSENESIIISDSYGNDVVKLENNLLTYKTDKTDFSTQVKYNEIIVPNGKRFHILLSDGTLVYVNSGTHLRYPVSFANCVNREVFINGEGYFEVSKDAKKPFIVNSQHGFVKVLGTHFNVLAYHQDDYFKTTLAEGSVEVGLTGTASSKRIVPGEAALWNKGMDDLEIYHVNIDNDIVWIHNRLLFINESFSEIRKKIERSYGVEINNQNKSLSHIRFNGDFDIESETVEDVLNAFQTTGYFNYSIKNNVIIIK